MRCFQSHPKVKVCVAASVLALAAANGSAHAAVAPYSQNFDTAPTGSTLPADFVESGPGAPAGGTADYSVQPDAPAGNDLQALISATTAASGTTAVPANRSAAVSFPAVAGSNFTLSSEFTIDSFNSGGSSSTLNFGLAALGSLADFSSGSNYRLLYTPFTSTAGGTGKLTLSESGSTGLMGTTSASTLTSSGTLTPAAGLTGTLTLTGTYNGGTLRLDGTLVSGATTLTVVGTDATPLTGAFFGYRTAANAVLGSGQTGPQTTSQDIDYDNFSLVPEPGSFGLVAAGLLALASRRRRA